LYGEDILSRGLRNEPKRRRPFDSLEQEAMLALLRTGDHLQIQVARLCRAKGITPAQYNILRVLRGAAGPLPSLEVAARLITAVPGITGLIDRLVRLGLVLRRRCEEDRRVVYVEITDAGRKMLEEMDAPVRTLHTSLLGHLSKTELRTLIKLLEKAREVPEEDAT
jgi:DNA-binding MarR family transcriptional regulator